MAEVSKLQVYPVTGCAGISVEHSMITAGGLQHDRQFVLAEDGFRVSAKQFPKLIQVQVGLGRDGINVSHPDQSDMFVPYGDEYASITDHVDEFSDLVPCTDTGDRAADFFSSLLPGAEVRLLEKIYAWRNGEITQPSQRRNAPVHIVNEASVEALLEHDPSMDFDSDRFRGAVMVSGLEPFEEYGWVGRTMRAGYASFGILRGTPRCPVPGLDPKTGANRKDVPKLYRHLAQEHGDHGKRIFGVYAYPYIAGSAVRSVISVDDKVEII